MPVDVTLVKGVVIVGAGVASGFINAIVGSGSLISFPALVGSGFERLTANIANNIGQFPGSLSAVHGFRRELKGQESRIRRFVPASLLGSIIGALLLLRFPGSFKEVVPILVMVGVVLVLSGPKVQARVKARRAAAAAAGITTATDHINPLAFVGVFLAGIYGGYFGAAQGVILVGVLGMAISDELVRINALKNVLAATVNGIAAVVFIARGYIHFPWFKSGTGIAWLAAFLIGIGAIAGAQIGALSDARFHQTCCAASSAWSARSWPSSSG